ncbi:hypothetical protein MLD38_011156 [Melastoma candidum]|uniref:Uncharacterized protein n=1 Tax=Melastoma candidum TaxID=119954 RepID=A0ACB9R569_9MYRT|nr:hypothetical protein MLD38_011156 [Melastoma candidum]
MLHQFGATSETLSKASTLVFRLGTDAHLYDDPEDVNIAPLLDSKFDSEKCEALKRLLALIAQGFDVSNFFPQVVKNVASQSLEVKKLVYLYLLHYAEKRPNEALLSINCFQKDLGDTNPLVRAWALRAMAGIRLHMIAPLVLVAVNKCARDPSVYVRKCAANALPKLHDLRIEENNSQLVEIVGILLNDNSPGVVGAAAAAFSSVCPDNFSLIGKSYRRLCEILPDVEEWGQIVLIGILSRFVIARHGLVRESVMSSLHEERKSSETDGSVGNSVDEEQASMGRVNHLEFANMVCRSYMEGPDEYLSRSNSLNGSPLKLDGACYTSAKSNDDVQILLQCTSPLLWSHNSAVVLAAAGVHWIIAPVEETSKIVKPLLFVLRSSVSSRFVVLSDIQVFAKTMPSLFTSHFEDFFICSSDTSEIRALKLDILSYIAIESTIPFILKELQDYVRDPDRKFAADAVAAIGLCAERLPTMAERCLDGLLSLIRLEFLSGEPVNLDEEGFLTQIIMSVWSIIKKDPSSHEKVIVQLIRYLDLIKVPRARAIVIWMVGEYNSIGERLSKVLTVIMQYLAWCFKSDAIEVKLQILTATFKILLDAKEEDSDTFQKVVNYILDMAEVDQSYDIRDRARILKKLLDCNMCSVPGTTDKNILEQENPLHMLAKKHLFGDISKSVLKQPLNARFYLPGSLSQMVVHAAPGYEPLPKPCSFLIDTPEGDSDTTDGTDPLTGSVSGESTDDYNSQNSVSGSSRNTAESGSGSEADEAANPLIEISEVNNVPPCEDLDAQTGSVTGAIISSKVLESWLEEPGSSTGNESQSNQVHRSSARIRFGDIGKLVERKSNTLLDLTNGNGLKVEYSFSSEISTISPHLVCVELSFSNCSSEPMPDLFLLEEETEKRQESGDKLLSPTQGFSASHSNVPTLIPMEEIACLEPGETMKRTIQVHFHHHLLPLRLALYSDGRRIPVKLRPDIGFFIKPLPMDSEAFTNKESGLCGMFEYTRRCAFNDHLKCDDPAKDKFLGLGESLAVKMLSNVNLSLVSVDMPVDATLDDATGLCLRLSSEIPSSSAPCLITITVEGKCSEPVELCVKVNCEETVFGLNLLNRLVNLLAEPSN